MACRPHWLGNHTADEIPTSRNQHLGTLRGAANPLRSTERRWVPRNPAEFQGERYGSMKKNTVADDEGWTTVTYKRWKKPSRGKLQRQYRGADGVDRRRNNNLYDERGRARCFRCRDSGHMARDCRNGLLCYKCRGVGHTAASCHRQTRRFPMKNTCIYTDLQHSPKTPAHHNPTHTHPSIGLHPTENPPPLIRRLREILRPEMPNNAAIPGRPVASKVSFLIDAHMGRALNKLERAVILRTEDPIAKADLTSLLARYFQTKEGWELGTLRREKNVWLVHFPSPDLAAAAVACGPMDLRGCRCFCIPWTREWGAFEREENFKCWLEIRRLPLFLWSEDAVRKLLSGFGELECLGVALRTSENFETASVLLSTSNPARIPHNIILSVKGLLYRIPIIIININSEQGERHLLRRENDFIAWGDDLFGPGDGSAARGGRGGDDGVRDANTGQNWSPGADGRYNRRMKQTLERHVTERGGKGKEIVLPEDDAAEEVEEPVELHDFGLGGDVEAVRRALLDPKTWTEEIFNHFMDWGSKVSKSEREGGAEDYEGARKRVARLFLQLFKRSAVTSMAAGAGNGAGDEEEQGGMEVVSAQDGGILNDLGNGRGHAKTLEGIGDIIENVSQSKGGDLETPTRGNARMKQVEPDRNGVMDLFNEGRDLNSFSGPPPGYSMTTPIHLGDKGGEEMGELTKPGELAMLIEDMDDVGLLKLIKEVGFAIPASEDGKELISQVRGMYRIMGDGDGSP